MTHVLDYISKIVDNLSILTFVVEKHGQKIDEQQQRIDELEQKIKDIDFESKQVVYKYYYTSPCFNPYKLDKITCGDKIDGPVRKFPTTYTTKL